MTKNQPLTISDHDTVTKDSLVAMNTTLTLRVRKQFFLLTYAELSIIIQYLFFSQHSSVFCWVWLFEKFNIENTFAIMRITVSNWLQNYSHKVYGDIVRTGCTPLQFLTIYILFSKAKYVEENSYKGNLDTQQSGLTKNFNGALHEATM